MRFYFEHSLVVCTTCDVFEIAYFLGISSRQRKMVFLHLVDIKLETDI